MIEEEIAYGGKDRAEIKHQFRGTVETIPVFRIMDKEELEVRDRWMKIKTRSIAGDALIWGHPLLGKWGQQKWRSQAAYSFIIGHPGAAILGQSRIGSNLSSWQTARVIQAEKIYREWFYDDEFKDASNTTANWDKTNHMLAFSSGDIAQSTSIYYNNENIVGARLTAEYSGTISFFLSNNGGNSWTSVNEGVLCQFSSYGEDLKWKASAQTNATLNYLNIEIIT